MERLRSQRSHSPCFNASNCFSSISAIHSMLIATYHYKPNVLQSTCHLRARGITCSLSFCFKNSYQPTNSLTCARRGGEGGGRDRERDFPAFTCRVLLFYLLLLFEALSSFSIIFFSVRPACAHLD